MKMKTITVQDGNQYFYTISDSAAVNPLGVLKATLTEYSLYRTENAESPVGKLYKTKEGNWYDAPNSNMTCFLSSCLKIALDASEIHQTQFELY